MLRERARRLIAEARASVVLPPGAPPSYDNINSSPVRIQSSEIPPASDRTNVAVS